MYLDEQIDEYVWWNNCLDDHSLLDGEIAEILSCNRRACISVLFRSIFNAPGFNESSTPSPTPTPTPTPTHKTVI